MTIASIAAATAATAFGAMYVDGRFALSKDLKYWRQLRRAKEIYVQAGKLWFPLKENRLSLYYIFENSVRRNPDAEAIWSREGCYTWAEIYERVHQYGQWFLSQGIRPGDYVAFYLHNSPDFAFAWLGLWSIGAAPAMINYNLSGDALIHCLKTCGAKVLLVDGDQLLRAQIDGVRGQIESVLGMHILQLDKETRAMIYSSEAKRPVDGLREGVTGKSPLSMLFTSGTTGLPKGVPLQLERGFLASVTRQAGNDVITDDERWYNCMPFYHGTGGVILCTMLTNGVTVCIGKKFSTSNFWKDVHDSRATIITYVGETARYLLAAPPSPLDRHHSVRIMYGNGLRPDVWHKFRDRFNVPEIIEFFNSSEGVFALVNHCRGDYLATAVGHHGIFTRYKYKNALVPVLVDETSGHIVRDPKTGFAIRQPYEKGGEIIVKTPMMEVFAGYYGNKEATLKKFAFDVFQKGDIWYRSGDSLRRTADGRWFFLDRLGDTFRWKGENVSTAEVAAVLGKYPGILEAIVYGVTLPAHDGRAGCAAIYIDPEAESKFDFDHFLQYSRAHLPRYAVPLFLRLLKEMKPIHNNKQNKAPLRAEGVDPAKIKEQDVILWISENGKGRKYEKFKPDNWESLQMGKAML